MAESALKTGSQAGLRTRWAALSRQLGALNATLYLIDHMLSRATGGRARLVRYHIVAQPIGVPGAARLRPDSKTRLAMTPADSPLVAQFPRPASVIQARFSAGGQCLSAVVDEDFAGYVWWQRDRYEEDEVRCTFVLRDARCCVWDYDVYVAPRYRFGRTMARLWQAVDDHLAGQGVAWSLSRISAFNPASLSAHARLGTVHCECATFLVVGPVQFAWLEQSPYLHLSWRHRQRPRLSLGPP